MWIVRLALNRPYTFVVMAILIAILGSSAIVTMPVDIFPYIDIPVVSVLWVYSGLSPEEMEKRVVTNFERSVTSNVNDIEHIESQAYNGYAVIKIYFHPNVKIDMAVAQTTATMQTALRQMPPGMFPANILKYDAASVPILQLGLSSKTLREQEIFDLGNNSPSVLFSLFLAKLVLVHRKLLEANGAMRLCAVKPHIMEVFQACRLENYFEFAPDRESALAELNAGA